MTTTSAPLPPPTPTELAVIRARLDGRCWLGTKGARRPLRVAAFWAGLLAVLCGMFAAVTVYVRTDDRGWVGVAGAIGMTTAAIVLAVDRSVARRVDRLVRARLAAEPCIPPTPETSAGPARRTGRRLDPLRPAAGVLAIAIIAVLAIALLARDPGPLTAITALGPLALLAMYAAAAVRMWRVKPLGSTPVLLAVDGALARRDLWHPAYLTGSVLGPYLLVFVEPHRLWTLWVLLAAVATGIVNQFVMSIAAVSDTHLLEDWRLPHAAPPQEWLASPR